MNTWIYSIGFTLHQNKENWRRVFWKGPSCKTQRKWKAVCGKRNKYVKGEFVSCYQGSAIKFIH